MFRGIELKKTILLMLLLGMSPGFAGAVGLSDAVTAVKSASATVAENSRDLFEKAQKFFQEKKYKKSKELLDQLVAKNRMEDFIPRARLLLANLQDDFNTSIEQFKSLAVEYNKRPEGEEARISLGARYYLADRFTEASESYKEFIEQYPKSPALAEARYWYASSLGAMDKNDQAIEEFKKVVQSAPDSPWAPKAFIGMGNAYFKMKKYNDAEKHYLKILDQYHYHDELNIVYFKLGQTFEMEKKPKEAHAAYRTLVERFPKALEVSEARERMLELEKTQPELAKLRPTEPPAPEPTATPAVEAASQAVTPEAEAPVVSEENLPEPAAHAGLKPFHVQVGVYSKKANVTKAKKAVRKAGYRSTVLTVKREGVPYPIYKVRVGNFPDRASAEKVARILAKKTREKAIVVED
jgi:TolA-binding protein